YGQSYASRRNRIHLSLNTPSTGAVDQFVSYDAMGRPVNESYVPGGAIGYSYDIMGNRTVKAAGGPPDFYGYTAGHRLLNAGPRSQSWNMRGEVTHINGVAEIVDY